MYNVQLLNKKKHNMENLVELSKKELSAVSGGYFQSALAVMASLVTLYDWGS